MILLFTYWGEKASKTMYRASAHTTAASRHTHSGGPSLSQFCLQRNRCNYWVLRLWLPEARTLGCDISTSIPFLSSLRALWDSSILFYRSCLGNSVGWGPTVKLYQLNDQPFLLLTLAIVSKAHPRCVNGPTHKHIWTHTRMHPCSGPNRTKHSGS